MDPTKPGDSLIPLFDLLLEHVPPPSYEPEHPLQAMVTNLDASPYLGRLAICRVRHGTITKGQRIGWCRADGNVQPARSASSSSPRRSSACRAESAGPGEIIAVSGLDDVTIGETLADPTTRGRCP